MVDSIGAKPSVAGDRSVARVAAATPTTAVQTPVQPQAQASVPPESIGLAKSMASAAPVNASRVTEIKKAIASGNFPILPATIADRLMAFRLDWTSNDKA
ncbi:flagellar biosynthesis anti-sigma factor FlgM [Sphingomonas sp. LB3N6]|uniref:flagellar biosynthesis anti-sigma factor FlgM n=1 Tax=Sphingomonas fucosidasi TaxID=3096164 RepID=UPI002FC9B9B7